MAVNSVAIAQETPPDTPPAAPTAIASKEYVDEGLNALRAHISNVDLAEYIKNALINAPGGVAGLDSQGKISAGQLPDLSGTYIHVDEKGAVDGVATLNENKKVLMEQLPIPTNIPDASTMENIQFVAPLVPYSDLGLSGSDLVRNSPSNRVPASRLPVGYVENTVAAGNDSRFHSVPTAMPGGTPLSGQVFIWFE